MNKQLPKHMLSVDPGGDSGWAFWIDGEFQECGLCDGRNSQKVFRLLSGIQKKDPKCRRVLVIEDQFIGDSRKRESNWNTGKKLIERRVRWQVLAELLGWEVFYVFPSSWQSKILKGVPGENTKTKSIFYASSLVGFSLEKLGDVADSICVGNFWLRREQGEFPFPKKGKSKTKRKGRKNV